MENEKKLGKRMVQCRVCGAIDECSKIECLRHHLPSWEIVGTLYTDEEIEQEKINAFQGGQKYGGWSTDTSEAFTHWWQKAKP